MATEKKLTDFNFGEKLSKFDSGELNTIINAVMDEVKDFKLDNDARKVACAELGVDMATAQGWQTVSDVIKHFDLAYLCEKHPDALKSILITACNVVGAICPIVQGATNIVSNIANHIPDKYISKFLGVPLQASPDHLIHVLSDYFCEKKRQDLHEYELNEDTVENKKNLVVVCKDDLLFDQFKKLVETYDDDENAVVGVKDGTVRIIRWDEDKWAYRYSVNNITEKVLVVGDVKGVKNQPVLMEKKLDEYGVKYGWIGNIAYISANRQELKSKELYAKFSNELNQLEVPDDIKQDKTFKLNLKTGLKAALLTPILIKDFYDDATSVLKQQYYYGIFKFYYLDLATFLTGN